MTIAHNLGFPPLGAHRELKRATEGYWSGKVPQAALLQTGAELRAARWRLQRDAGVDLIPSNDFSYYDRVLDACAMVGAVPTRYGWSGGSFYLDTYFAMARGVQSGGSAGWSWSTRCCRCTPTSWGGSTRRAPRGCRSTSRASRSIARLRNERHTFGPIASWPTGPTA